MIKLLLVEDDPNLRYVVQCGLEDIIGGYDVQTAVNGEEGLKTWASFKPDIVISDIDMPVMDGFEMVRRIRETDANTPHPVCLGPHLAQGRTIRLSAGRKQLRKEALHRRGTGCAHTSRPEDDTRCTHAYKKQASVSSVPTRWTPNATPCATTAPAKARH